MILRALGFLVIGTFTIITGGCATQEWRQANGECARNAYAAHPPINENRIVRRSELVRVPDGNTSCKTEYIRISSYSYPPKYEAKTECTQGTKLENRFYNETITVDLNKDNRDNATWNCTVRLCQQLYGNADCKPPKQNAETTQAKAILQKWFGSDWVNNPVGSNLYAKCGNIIAPMPFGKINAISYYSWRNAVKVGIIDNIEPLKRTCASINHEISGTITKEEFYIIKKAFEDLGGKNLIELPFFN